MLRPSAYLGARSSLVLLFRVYLYYRAVYPRLPDLLRPLPRSRYLALMSLFGCAYLPAYLVSRSHATQLPSS